MSDPKIMKIRKTYAFTVEGKTEKWYLDRIETLINEQCDDCIVSIKSKVETNPYSYFKRVTRSATPLIVHLCDFEGKSAGENNQFLKTLETLTKINRSQSGNFRYELGYSNLTFELWIILHKCDCFTNLTDKKKYLDIINKAYGTRFESLAKCKEEANFQKLLSQLTLADVRDAVARAEKIMKRNKENGLRQKQHKGFSYYEDNPSLTIWESIKRILKECELM